MPAPCSPLPPTPPPPLPPFATICQAIALRVIGGKRWQGGKGLFLVSGRVQAKGRATSGRVFLKGLTYIFQPPSCHGTQKERNDKL